MPIWSYDFFPSFWQFVNFIPNELPRLGGQEWIKPIFDTLFWCEPYSSEGVLHRPEQMVIRRGKVWAIRRVMYNFPSTVFQIVLNRNSNGAKRCHDGILLPRVWSHIPGVFRLFFSSNGLIVFGSVLHWRFHPILADHNTAHPSDPTKYRALPSRHGYSAVLLIWLVGRVAHMIFCAWGYRNGSIFHHQ